MGSADQIQFLGNLCKCIKAKKTLDIGKIWDVHVLCEITLILGFCPHKATSPLFWHSFYPVSLCLPFIYLLLFESVEM